MTNELTCGITRSRPVRIAETESSPSRESADAFPAGTWPKTGQNRALAARARQGKPNQEESRTCERANSCDTKYHVSAASAPWNCARETAEGGVSGPCAEGCQASQGDASSHPSLYVSWGGAHRGQLVPWYSCFIAVCALPTVPCFNFTTSSPFHPQLAVVLLELLTPQTILRQVIAGRTVLWEASKPPTRRMTMLRVLTRAGPTCLRHTVPTPAGTGAGLQEGKHRSIRPCVGPKVHTGTALPSGNSWSRVGWRWRVKPPNAVTVAGGYAIAVFLLFWFPDLRMRAPPRG